jgi:hypothetical protein
VTHPSRDLRQTGVSRATRSQFSLLPATQTARLLQVASIHQYFMESDGDARTSYRGRKLTPVCLVRW